MRAVVALGNPGPRYANTRHNAGFRVADALASPEARWASAPNYDHTLHPESGLLLFKPTTYMNDSGLAVRDILHAHDVSLQDILVLADDIHLDPGRIRIRRGGSDGGHNGIKSIIASVGEDTFPRLRLGIGSPDPEDDLMDFVLGEFGPDEREAVERLVQTAVEAVLCWSSDGIESAMNRFNGLP